MSLRKQFGRWIVSQFTYPRGLPGRLVGWEMALRPSNRKRNAWAVSLMDVQPSDRVLEIGFGPGIAVREIARRATHGQVVGIDRSAVMCAQAARRNAAAIRAGRVSFTVASIDDPPAFDRPFDKTLAVNNMGMWSEPALRLKELAGLLRIHLPWQLSFHQRDTSRLREALPHRSQLRELASWSQGRAESSREGRQKPPHHVVLAPGGSP